MTIEVMPLRRLAFRYRNWRGEVADRTVTVRGLHWGSTEWHPEPGWLLEAVDDSTQEVRLFSMRDMEDVRYA